LQVGKQGCLASVDYNRLVTLDQRY
jgi:hypothetical protein